MEKSDFLNQSEYRTARWLCNIGITRRRRLFKSVFFLFPDTAWLAFLLAEYARPENGVFWYWSPEPDDGVLDGVLADVSEIINRARVPYGDDNYCIRVMCFSPLPADQEHLADPGYLESTLPQRSIVAEWKVSGNRWRDWKRGNGKDALRRLLWDAAPDKDRPVTLVSAVVIGTTVARAVNLSRAT